MKLRTSTLLMLVFTALASTTALGQITYISAFRSVAWDCGMMSRQFSNTGGFEPFDASVPTFSPAAFQQSTLTSSSIVGHGWCTPTVFCPNGDVVSRMTVRFTVAQPVDYRLELSLDVGGQFTQASCFFYDETNSMTLLDHRGSLDGDLPPTVLTGTLQPGAYYMELHCSWATNSGGPLNVDWNINFTASLPPLDVVAGPYTNPANGHRYLLLSPGTHPQADAAAQSVGGHLVTINDDAENDYVLNHFGALCTDQEFGYWIGLNDAAMNGAFVWTSGEPVTFTNWSCGEPNGGTSENYVHAWGPAGVPCQRAPGTWNDLPLTGWALNAVVELPAPPFTIDWSTIDDGGGTVTGGNFELAGTIGQYDAGRVSGGAFCINGGYWPGALPPYCFGDANKDRRITFADITSVLQHFNMLPDACRGEGDANASRTVNFADVTSVLQSFTLPCP